MNRREAIKRTAAITGMAVSSSITIGLLESCQPKGKPIWPPVFLKQDEIKLISAMSDAILPKTDTVGALDVHVPEFIDLMLRDCLSDEEQNHFKAGLALFIARVDQGYSNLFEACTSDEKAAILEAEEEKMEDQSRQTSKKSFYQTVKELTLLGFFTSEKVMKSMLDYHPIPGRYDGCVPMTVDSRVYVDNNV